MRWLRRWRRTRGRRAGWGPRRRRRGHRHAIWHGRELHVQEPSTDAIAMITVVVPGLCAILSHYVDLDELHLRRRRGWRSGWRRRHVGLALVAGSAWWWRSRSRHCRRRWRLNLGWRPALRNLGQCILDRLREIGDRLRQVRRLCKDINDSRLPGFTAAVGARFKWRALAIDVAPDEHVHQPQRRKRARIGTLFAGLRDAYEEVEIVAVVVFVGRQLHDFSAQQRHLGDARAIVVSRERDGDDVCAVEGRCDAELATRRRALDGPIETRANQSAARDKSEAWAHDAFDLLRPWPQSGKVNHIASVAA